MTLFTASNRHPLSFRCAVPCALAAIAAATPLSESLADSAVPNVAPSQTFEFSVNQSPGSTTALGGDWAAMRVTSPYVLTLFHRDASGTWGEHSTIALPSGLTGSRPALIHEDLLFVGVSTSSAAACHVRVYSLSADAGATLISTIPNPSNLSLFGNKIAFHGSTLVVGLGDSGTLPWTFERTSWDTWSSTGQLPIPPGPVSASFAGTISIDGDRMAISDPGVKSLVNPSVSIGRVHVYERSRGGPWVHATSFSGPEVPASINFSRPAVSGDTIAVGAPWWPGPDGTHAGRVYIFDRDATGTWNESGHLDPDPPIMEGLFGWRVRLNGNRLAVGDSPPDFLWPTTKCMTTFVRDDQGTWHAGLRFAWPWHGVGGIVGSVTMECDGETIMMTRTQSGYSYFHPSIALLNGAFDCDDSGVADALEIDAGLTLDCNANRRPDPCDAAAGRLDSDGDQVLDYCSSDCNGNLIPDGDDLASGVVPDCNQNGIPDSCEVALGLAVDIDGDGSPDDCAVDCNDNGIPDSFEVASGTAHDCDGDGVLDECGAYSQLPDSPVVATAFGGGIKGVEYVRRFEVAPGRESISRIDIGLGTVSAYCPSTGMTVTVGLFADDQLPGPSGSTLLWSTSFVTGTITESPTMYSVKFPPIVPGAVGDDFYVAILSMKPPSCGLDGLSPLTTGLCESELQPDCVGTAFINFVTTLAPNFVATTQQAFEYSIVYIPALWPVSLGCNGPADVNGDGHVDGADITSVLGSWGPCAQCGQCDADLNGDCNVDGAEIAIVLGWWTD